jgi:uncharacterized protein involved in exopolysaccharide biosynthesis
MIRKVEEGGDMPAARAAGLSALTLPVAIVAGAVSGYLFSFMVSPVFIADARILVGGNSQLTAGYEPFAAGVVESEVAVLKSRELALQAIRQHDLARRLDTGVGPSLLDTLLIAAGLKANPSRATIEERALDALEDRLSVAPVGSSRVIDITYSGADSDLAAKTVNALADIYVSDQTVASQRSDQATLQWLQGEIEMLRQRVGEADRRLERQRSGSELFSVFADGRRTDLASQELSQLNGELVRARAAHAEALARARVVKQILKQGSSVEAAREVLDSALIQRLREQQVKLQSEMAELSSTYLASHPKIVSLQSLMDDLDKQIRAEIRKVLKSVEMAAEISGARVMSLQESLNEVKSAAARSSDKGVELRALEQDARAQRELLETFLTRYRTLAADSGGQRPGARIISRARPPNHATSPVRPFWVAGGAAAGLAFAFMLALFNRIGTRGRAADTSVDGEEVAELLRAARRQARKDRFDEVIGQLTPEPAPLVPQAQLSENPMPGGEGNSGAADWAGRQTDESRLSMARTQPPSNEEGGQLPSQVAVPRQMEDTGQTAETGRSMAAQIGQWIENAPGTAELGRLLAEGSERIILFAGTGAGDGPDQGTDHLALAAACHTAKAGRNCVVLDIGMRPSPVLTPDVRAPGLGHLISGTAPFGHVIRHDAARGVDLIGMGRALGNPPLTRLTTAIASLTKRYDKVILVADRVEDWPNRFVRPDFALLVCEPELDDRSRRTVYESVLQRGARKALIVRSEWPLQQPANVAA